MQYPMLESLTQRERECLASAAKDRSLCETAQDLFISPETVKSHRKVVLRKLGCRTIGGAIVVALRNQMIGL